MKKNFLLLILTFVTILIGCNNKVKENDSTVQDMNSKAIPNSKDSSNFIMKIFEEKDMAFDNRDSLSFYFLGYRLSKPYFRGEDGNLFYYLYKNDSLILAYKKIKEEFTPQFLNNKGIVLSHKTDSQIFINFFSGYQAIINLPFIPIEICTNDEISKIYLLKSYDEPIYEYDYKSMDLRKMELFGYNLNFINNNLYYLEESEKIGFVNVLKYSIANHTINTMLTNVFDEGLFISPEGQYIFCFSSINGNPKRIIYDTQKRTSVVLDSLYEGYSYTTFDQSSKGFLFYEPTGLKVKYYEID